MTYGEASVPENLDKSIDELKAYYVSRPVQISNIYVTSQRGSKKKSPKKLTDRHRRYILFQDMACKIPKDTNHSGSFFFFFLEKLALQASQLLLQLDVWEVA